MTRLPRSPRCLALLAAAAALGGCYQRDVNYKPFFSGLAGAQHNTPPARSERPAPALSPADPRIVIDNPDGSVTLVSRRGLHLMRHIQRTIALNEKEVFVEQVLSERTRQEYLGRGLDPARAFETLQRYEREINELFRWMPLGEQTPQVIVSGLGNNTFRVKLTGAATKNLQWTYFDMVLEQGNYRLRWFGPVAEPRRRKA